MGITSDLVTVQKVTQVTSLSGSNTCNGGNQTISTITVPQLGTGQFLLVKLSLNRTSGTGGATLTFGSFAHTGTATGSILIGSVGYVNDAGAFSYIGTTSANFGSNIYTGSRNIDLVINGNNLEVWKYTALIYIVG